MSRAMRSDRNGESGFTLIEVLIVVAILVALSVAIIPNVVQFGGKGKEGQKASEKAAVQTAMDSLIATEGASGVTGTDGGGANANNNWTNKPAGVTDSGGTAVFLNPKYLPVTSTVSFYCYDNNGKITRQQDAATPTC